MCPGLTLTPGGPTLREVRQYPGYARMPGWGSAGDHGYVQEPREQPWPPFRFASGPGGPGISDDPHWHGAGRQGSGPSWPGPGPGPGWPGPGWQGQPPRHGDMPDWVARRARRWRERGDGEPLRRHPEDRLAGGIASGLGAWRGYSPTTVRIALAVAALISDGWAVPFYVLGWLLIPVKGEETTIAQRARHDSRGVVLALALASLLAVFLFLAGRAERRRDRRPSPGRRCSASPA